MTEDWRHGYNWLSGMELLSLDFLRPVYDDLGTGIGREETLRGLARDALLWHLNPGFHREPQSTEGMAAFFRYQVGALVQIAESALGEGAGQALAHWIQFVQCQESTNPWTKYQDLFLSWASKLRTTGVDAIGFSLGAAEVAERLRESVNAGRVRETLERRRSAFLTEWDFRLFKERGLLEIRDGSPFFPFVDAAILTVEMHRFQTFWMWLVSTATSQDLKAIDVFVRAREETDVAHVAPWELPIRTEMPQVRGVSTQASHVKRKQ